MIEMKAQIAHDLVPLMKHLYEGGILSVYGGDGSVHMTESCFHKVFPEIKEPKERSGEYPFYWTATVDGVEFFALSRDGKLEVPYGD